MRTPRVAPALFAAIAILTGGLAETASAEFPGRNGLLEYTAADGIHTIQPDGSQDRLIIGDGYGAQWSPTGRQVVFVAEGVLRYARADGTGRRTVIRGSRLEARNGLDIIFDAGWAPDGRRIVFAAADGDDDQPSDHILTIRRDGTSLRKLHRGEAPKWSPDGRHIAFLRFPTGGEFCSVGNRLALIAPRGGRARTVAQTSCCSEHDFSPTGRRLALVDGCGANAAIRVVDVRRRASRTLSLPANVSPSASHGVTWSPDGEWIAFVHPERPRNPLVSTEPEAYHVYAIRPNGRSARRLFTLPGAAFGLSWQPLR